MRKFLSILVLSLTLVFAGSTAYANNVSNENSSIEATTENQELESMKAAIRNIMDCANKSFLEMDARRKAVEEKVEETVAETVEMEEETEEEIQQEETKVAETKPVETKPVETKPAATKPAETKPAETKPAATKPAETKPAETKPVTTKPAETKPAATQPAPTTQAPTTQAPAPVGGINADQQNKLTGHLVAAINNVRASVGASGLNLDGGLVSIAAVRANEASVCWSHTRPNGTRGIDMIPANKWRGENLSKVVIGGFDGSDAQLAALGQRIVNNWVASSGHYANLVSGNFTNIGLYTYVVVNGNTCTFYTAAMFSN